MPRSFSNQPKPSNLASTETARGREVKKEFAGQDRGSMTAVRRTMSFMLPAARRSTKPSSGCCVAVGLLKRR